MSNTSDPTEPCAHAHRFLRAFFMLLFDFLGNKPSVMFLGLKVQRCIVMEFMSEVIRDSLPKIVGLGEILRQTENVHVHFYADVGYN